MRRTQPLRKNLAKSHPSSPEVRANQESFRQKGSNSHASLQPWLDELLNAGGLVRCYATEDTNPRKQLKLVNLGNVARIHSPNMRPAV